MKPFKKLITGMLVISLLVIFGTLTGAGGIYRFFADTGFSGTFLAVLECGQLLRCFL